MTGEHETSGRWYAGITRYQWLVLLIASLGWVFDVFEGQIFVASMREAMPSLLPEGAASGVISYYNNIALASFLFGGAVGGVFFGIVSDRIGRTRTMILTILMYSLFTCVTALAQSPGQMVALRFLVAMGVGGEWAVASAMVAEVFPRRARAWSLGIFHASSVFGTYLAVGAGALVVGNPAFGWRWGFALGALPAVLTLWIRMSIREPEMWVQAREMARRDATQQPGRLSELFTGPLRRHTLVGVSLAAVGLATFWGVHIYGKNAMLESVRRQLVETQQTGSDSVGSNADDDEAHARRLKNAEMIGMFLVTTGGGLGLLAFGPISEKIGRRGAFLLFHTGGLVSALALFQLFWNVTPPVLWLLLPVFGFLTLGMHAGYAIYFPELFPTRLRGTGGGFCFNVGRITAAPILVISGWLQAGVDFRLSDKFSLNLPLLDDAFMHDIYLRMEPMSLENSASLLSLLFLLGIVVLAFAPETRGRDLPE